MNEISFYIRLLLSSDVARIILFVVVMFISYEFVSSLTLWEIDENVLYILLLLD